MANHGWSIVYLEDVADIYQWASDLDSYTYYIVNQNQNLKDTVYLWVAKKKRIKFCLGCKWSERWINKNRVSTAW